MAGSHSTSDIVFLRYDIVIDGINSFQVILVTCQCCHVSHTGIHITGTDSMPPCLRLLNDGFVTLRIEVTTTRLATVVQQELRFIKIFLLTCQHIEASQCHLRDLMTWHHTSLTCIRSHLTDDTVSITFGDIQEFFASCRLIVGAGSIHHVTEVIQLMAQEVLHFPALLACPMMWMRRVDGTGGIQVTVWLLGSTHHVQH